VHRQPEARQGGDGDERDACVECGMEPVGNVKSSQGAAMLAPPSHAQLTRIK
jgi:hypothetical protein